MVRIDREQLIAIGALSLLLFVCVFAIVISLQARSAALQELNVRSVVLARIEAQSGSRIDRPGRQLPTIAPGTAYYAAATQGLAVAQLQSYVARLAAAQQAIVISSGVELAREDSPDMIRVQSNLDMSPKALQTILFQLESGTPYVFVESLTVVPESALGQAGIQDQNLRVTMVLRTLWRREAS
jgi:general secretion pathway protein M